jgi:hypothetical protein
MKLHDRSSCKTRDLCVSSTHDSKSDSDDFVNGILDLPLTYFFIPVLCHSFILVTSLHVIF